MMAYFTIVSAFLLLGTATTNVNAFTPIQQGAPSHHPYHPTLTHHQQHVVQLSSQGNPNDLASNIRFLGRGDRAIVREGCCLVAPNHEYNHFLMRSVVFIHAIGTDEYGETVARGVIIDHPTAFTMGEMGGGSVSGILADNVLYQGGDNGNDSAMILHSVGQSIDASSLQDDSSSNFEGPTIDIACGEQIGMSGIYEGGVQDAMDLVDQAIVEAGQFKFFFNYVQFTDRELEGMLSASDSDGDAWCSLEVPSSFVLKDYGDRGDA